MKVKLKHWDMGDISSLSSQISNINIWNNVRDGMPYPYTEEDARTYIAMTMEYKGPQLNFAIEADDEVVGGIGIFPGEDVERVSAEIGYWIGEKHWGKGIATQAVMSMVEYVFQKLPVTRIFAGVYEYNNASMRVLEKAGFQKEAVLKKAVIKNSRIIDFHLYSRIKD